jgi:hypothetical protein
MLSGARRAFSPPTGEKGHAYAARRVEPGGCFSGILVATHLSKLSRAKVVADADLSRDLVRLLGGDLSDHNDKQQY